MRTRLTSSVSTTVRSHNGSGMVVAYEADVLDAQQLTGWSVAVTGRATTITDPDQIAYYERVLQPWVNMAMDIVLAIDPEIVSGIRIIADNP